MKFSDKLREERKKKGMSQKELGEKLGVSQAMIAQYEKGDRNPKKETIEKIAIALELPTSEFLGYNTNLSWIDIFSGGAAYRDLVLNEVLEKTELTEEDLENMLETNLGNKEEELLTNYRKLNDKGQEKAVDQVEMLTKIEEYTKKED